MWLQPSNSGAASGLNYPGDQAGLLTVISAGAMVYQTYTFFSAAGRGLANSTFTPWTIWWKLVRMAASGGGVMSRFIDKLCIVRPYKYLI